MSPTSWLTRSQSRLALDPFAGSVLLRIHASIPAPQNGSGGEGPAVIKIRQAVSPISYRHAAKKKYMGKGGGWTEIGDPTRAHALAGKHRMGMDRERENSEKAPLI